MLSMGYLKKYRFYNAVGGFPIGPERNKSTLWNSMDNQ